VFLVVLGQLVLRWLILFAQDLGAAWPPTGPIERVLACSALLVDAMTVLRVLAQDRFTMTPSTQQPLLVVHAGTHKTASSYIQNRLDANQLALDSQGVVLSWPGRPGRKHKGLVKAMLKGSHTPWERYLSAASPATWQLLVSAEQFTPAVTEPRHLAFLDEVARRHGRTLRVVVFLRDQPDFLNSMYAHTVRRLYHHYDFDSYVRRRLRHPNWFPDYSRWLEAIRRHPTIELLVLPYRSAAVDQKGKDEPLDDPFMRLAHALGWAMPGQGWLPPSRRSINTQVGARGIWLALEVGKALAARGVNPRSLRNTGGLIREISEREGWTHPRFQGFQPADYLRLRETLEAANDPLAMEAWGVPWAEVFPSVPQPRSITIGPESNQDAQRMDACLQEALSRLLKQVDSA
jgi:hypothetical protein